MASIAKKKRKSGTSYYIVYRITGEDGKRYQKWYPCKSRKDATNLLEDVEQAEKENREYKSETSNVYVDSSNAQGDMTVEELVATYVDHRSKTKKWEARTRQTALNYISNYIIPYIGDVKIANISTRVLQSYYNDLPNHKAVPGNHTSDPGYISGRTVREVHKVLRPAFALAKTWGEIPTNPALGLELPKIEKKERAWFEISDIIFLLQNCEDDTLKMLMATMFACTLRSGELLGLTWDCIDISEKAISSDSASVYVKKEQARLDNSSIKATSTTIYFTFPSHTANSTTSLVLKKPKTAASIRHVYLPSTLEKWFVDFKKKQDHWKREVGKEYHDYNLVFALSNGDPISNKVLNKRFKRFLREQGYPEHDFYSLRHSGVTAKLSTTGDLKAVQGDMGDETSQMVLDIYAKIVDSDRKKIAAQIENDVFSKTNRTEDTDAETPENS